MPNIAVEDTIEASADATWAKLADFGGLGAWAPGLTECKLEGEGVGVSQRHGRVQVRRLHGRPPKYARSRDLEVASCWRQRRHWGRRATA